METETKQPQKIYWQLIAPGAVMLILGARMADPTPPGFRVFLVAVGGLLLLVGLVRSFGMKSRR